MMPVALLNNPSTSHFQFEFPVMTTMFSAVKISSVNTNNVVWFFRKKSLSTTTVASASKSNNLFSRISPLRKSSQIIPVLEQWVQEGKYVHRLELQRIIRELRTRKRYSHALEETDASVFLDDFDLQVSEWMSSSNICSFSTGDCAVHLDLIGVIQGSKSAETYFNSSKNQEKNSKTYGALLNCYVREGLIDKCIDHVQIMEEIGYGRSTLVYNNLMCLYKQAGQLDKVIELMLEMKNKGLCPDNFSYRICITCFGMKSDLTGLEKVLEEMESQNQIFLDWSTYSVAANFYIKANLKEKAISCLKKLEDTLHRHKDAVGYNHLISLYAQLGSIDEVMRLWGHQKAAFKKHINRDYITMIGSLVKLGELEKAEVEIKEWESSCHVYDIRVVNILVFGYCQRDLVEKGEAMVCDIVKKGIVPTPNSWAMIAGGYINRDDMEKAFDCMKKALEVREENRKWVPKSGMVSKIMRWLGDGGMVEEMELLKRLLGRGKPVISRACEEGSSNGDLMRLKDDDLEEHEEVEMDLCLR